MIAMTTKSIFGDVLECAVEAATAAGDYAARNAHRRHEVVHVGEHDVKLALDVECQAVAEDAIRKRFPGHAIKGEEDALRVLELSPVAGRGACGAAAEPNASGSSEFRWIIDPIDGTVNFTHGMRIWCCSIAVCREDKAVAGAIFAPHLGELYTVAADGPALLNGAPLRVSSVEKLARSIVCTGADKEKEPNARPCEMFNRIAGAAQRPRILGSAALDLCHVASGRVDGYFENGIYIWDVAAGGLLVERAGGRSELLGKRTDGRLRFLATNGLIHAELKAAVEAG